ncbi:hypothetical protein KR074_003855 [Drosophila pseudoananassae]|nr:hypothetical protein KR074_003855 [Drosophila pseudoananassae]
MEVIMTKFECKNYLPDITQNVSCQVNREHHKSLFSAEFTLTEDVNNSTGIYSFSVIRGSTITNYLKVDIDFCHDLEAIQTQFLLKLIADELRRGSNFPLQCPFKKNTRYHLDNFTVDTNLIPMYAPEMTFKSDCLILINKRKALQVIVFGRVFRSRSGR